MRNARNGKNYTDMADELIDYSELEAVLWELAEDFRTNYRDKLERDDHFTRDTPNNYDGRLMDIPPDALHVEHQEGNYVVSIDLNDYWKYVEYDTRPHWPPREAILEWVRIKPAIPSPDKNGRIPTPEQLAFLISRRIAGLSPKGLPGGTKGNHAFEKTQEVVTGYYIPRIEEALGKVLKNYIRKILPD